MAVRFTATYGSGDVGDRHTDQLQCCIRRRCDIQRGRQRDSAQECTGATRTHAADDGGAIYSTGSGATVDLKDSAKVNGNVADLGGALYNVGGSTATMSDSAQMRYNAAGFGGAVWNGYAGSSFTMNGNAWLDHNTATDNGGAIINANGATTTLNGNSRLSYNQAQASWGLGGAIANLYDGATLTINDAASIDHNTAATNGGAIYNRDATVVMNGGKLSYNQAEMGGAIFNNGATAVLDLRHGEIDHNTAIGDTLTSTGGRGGAIYNYEGQVNLNTGSGAPFNIWYNTANIDVAGARLMYEEGWWRHIQYRRFSFITWCC